MNERFNSEVSLGRVPPVWVPDSYSSTCQECHVKFTFIIRKHHCRACGRLLCSYCSRFQEPLEYLGWNPSRVCGVCHEHFQKPKPRNGQPRRIRKTKSLNDFAHASESVYSKSRALLNMDEDDSDIRKKYGIGQFDDIENVIDSDDEDEVVDGVTLDQFVCIFIYFY